jgi:hypothetical protein
MSRTLVSCGFALALLGTFALEAAAQTSCSGWRQTCLSRCKQSGATSCPYCSRQVSECRQTGCWIEHPSRGGASHCNLKKS